MPLLLELLQQSHKSYYQYKSLRGGRGGENLNTVQTLLEIDFLVRTHAAAGQLCSSLFRVLLLVFSIDFQNLGLKNKFVGLWLLLQDSYHCTSQWEV